MIQKEWPKCCCDCQQQLQQCHGSTEAVPGSHHGPAAHSRTACCGYQTAASVLSRPNNISGCCWRCSCKPLAASPHLPCLSLRKPHWCCCHCCCAWNAHRPTARCSLHKSLRHLLPGPGQRGAASRRPGRSGPPGLPAAVWPHCLGLPRACVV